MKKRADIPNKEGFKFMAVMEDGSQVLSVVEKNENGLHFVKRFSEIVGWYDLPNACNPNNLNCFDHRKS